MILSRNLSYIVLGDAMQATVGRLQGSISRDSQATDNLFNRCNSGAYPSFKDCCVSCHVCTMKLKEEDTVAIRSMHRLL